MTAPRRTRIRNLLAVTSLGLVGLLAGLLSGCAAAPSNAAATTSTAVSFADLAGNWQIASTAAGNAGLRSLAGSLTVSGSSVSGMLHPLSGTCLTSTALAAPFAVAGTVDANGRLTLASTAFAGGAFHLTGTLAADQHSLLNPAYTISAGICATASLATPQDTASITTAQQFQPVNGTYTGSFADPNGVVMAVSAVLTQSSSADANGYFHLTGDATFANNPCLNAPVITDSVINGSTITATYTDAQTGNSIVGTGTFDATATNLTITNWTLSGSCGPDSGTGLLTK